MATRHQITNEATGESAYAYGDDDLDRRVSAANDAGVPVRTTRTKAPSTTSPSSTAPRSPAASTGGRGSGFGRSARDGAGSAFDAVKTSKGSAAHEGAGFILGALVWCWVVLPFMSGGLVGMKNTLRAKFINEGPDGKPL